MAEDIDFIFCCPIAIINPFELYTRDEDVEVEILEETEGALQRYSYKKMF